MANELSVQRTNAQLLETLDKADNAASKTELTNEATGRQGQIDELRGEIIKADKQAILRNLPNRTGAQANSDTFIPKS